MKASFENVTTLSDDIRHVVQSVYDNNLEIIRLCQDHKDPLLHHDKKPVLFISQDELVGIFDLNTHHFFLSPDQLFRMGTYCNLTMPRIIALMMKAIWEAYLSDMAGYSKDSGLRLELILKEQDLIEKYIANFKPHIGQLYRLIKNNALHSETEIAFDRFDLISSDLLEDSKFLIDNNRIGQFYPEKDLTEKTLLSSVSEEQREKYLLYKERWNIKSTELDEVLMRLEQQKRINLSIENKYFKTFGKLEAEKSRVIYRLEKTRMIFKIIQEQPELTYRDIINLALEKLVEAEKERSEIMRKISRSQHCINEIIPKEYRITASDEFKDAYAQACKKILRKLYFLLHSDTCPRYSGLSTRKKWEINKLWLQLMKSTKDEMYSFTPSMLLYNMPDYDQLRSIYKRTCEILEIDPEDFELGNRLDFMIRKGAPISSILEFLKNETKYLEIQLAQLDLVWNEYTREDLAHYYRNSLSNMNAHEEEIKKELAELKSHIKQIKEKIAFERNNAA